MSVPEKQWAQVVEQKGGPPVYKEIPVRKPAADEILVKIRYTGVCHTDLHAMKGDWPLPVKMPLVGGHEGAGVVVAKGELVNDFEIGDHAGLKWLNGSCLSCEFCQQAQEPLCPNAQLSGYTVDGTFQQYAIGKAALASKIPKNVPLDAVAPILCAGLTVYKGLKESGARPGQTVAIVGAGGGLGSLALQYAKAMGLRAVAIDGGEEKRQMCQSLGAEVFSLPPSTLFLNGKTNKGRHTSTSPPPKTSSRTSKPPRPAGSAPTPSCCSLSPRSRSSRRPTTCARAAPSSPSACPPTPSSRPPSSTPSCA